MRHQDYLTALQKKYFFGSLLCGFLVVFWALFLKSDHPFTQPIFFYLFSSHELSGGLLVLLIILVSFFWAPKTQLSTIDRVVETVGSHPFLIAFSSLIIFSVSSLLVYQNHPLTMDEFAPYFQAQVFAEGQFWGRYPVDMIPWLIPKLYEGHFLQVSHATGKIVSAYWPGFAILLTPFMKLQVPWLLNPLLVSGSQLLLYFIVKKIMPGKHAAGWVLLFTLASPAFVVNGISYYSMNAHLFMNLLFVVLLLNGTAMSFIFAGLVGAFALILHNPVPHLLFAIPWWIWLIKQPGRARKVLLLLAGYLPVVILIGFGWVWLKMQILQEMAGVSSPMVGGVVNAAQFAAQHSVVGDPILQKLISEPMRLIKEIFTFPELEFLWVRLLGWLKLFAWESPGLPILAIIGFSYAKDNLWLRLWGWSAVLTLVGFLFVPASQGHGWGFRYFHSAWAALPLLAGFFLADKNREQLWKQMAFVAILLSLFLAIPLRFYQVHSFIDQHLQQAPPLDLVNRQICFVTTWQGYFKQDLVMNDPLLENRVLFFVSHGFLEDNKFVKKYFPDALLVRKYGFDSVWEIPGKNT